MSKLRLMSDLRAMLDLRSVSPCQQFPPRPEVLYRPGAEGSDNLQTNVFQMVVVDGGGMRNKLSHTMTESHCWRPLRSGEEKG